MLGVTALGDSLRQAQRAAYGAIAGIRFDGMQYRTDIGYRALAPQAVTGTPIAGTAPDVAAVRRHFEGLQRHIVAALRGDRGRPFRRDEWTRPEGGGGVSLSLEERAACSSAAAYSSRTSRA